LKLSVERLPIGADAGVSEVAICGPVSIISFANRNHLNSEMPDPVTIGTIAASALAIGAEAIFKTSISEGVKDAYKALKSKLATWIANDIEALEKNPASKSRQGVVADEINILTTEDQAEVRRLTLALNEALRNAAKAGAVGIDIGRLEADNVLLGEINVSEGVGFRADEIKARKDFTVDSLTVGKPER
jgi:hypothetical protein